MGALSTGGKIRESPYICRGSDLQPVLPLQNSSPFNSKISLSSLGWSGLGSDEQVILCIKVLASGATLRCFLFYVLNVQYSVKVSIFLVIKKKFDHICLTWQSIINFTKVKKPSVKREGSDLQNYWCENLCEIKTLRDLMKQACMISQVYMRSRNFRALRKQIYPKGQRLKNSNALPWQDPNSFELDTFLQWHASFQVESTWLTHWLE